MIWNMQVVMQPIAQILPLPLPSFSTSSSCCFFFWISIFMYSFSMYETLFMSPILSKSSKCFIEHFFLSLPTQKSGKNCQLTLPKVYNGIKNSVSILRGFLETEPRSDTEFFIIFSFYTWYLLYSKNILF